MMDYISMTFVGFSVLIVFLGFQGLNFEFSPAFDTVLEQEPLSKDL